jgi:hypothetical protein
MYAETPISAAKERAVMNQRKRVKRDLSS